MSDAGLADDLGKRCRYAAEDHDDFGPGIVELVLELARRIERVDVHLDGACAQDPDHGDREGRNVRKHYGNAVAFLDAEQPLQEPRKVTREPVGVRIGQRLPEAAKSRLVREPRHGALEHLQHG